jgi:hypothetical protein
MGIDRAKELCCIIMDKNTRGIGKLIRDVVLGFKSFLMEVAMKEITSKIKWKAKGNISGLEARFIRASLRIISSMVLECGLMLREIPIWDNGIQE